MLLYIKNLLPRLRQFSQTLDKIELLVEHPWVLIDDENNQQKYIFQRNGSLIMSLNGKVTIGGWNYLAAAKSLLINRVQDKILLNHDFVDPAIMVLKMDGNKNLPFVLANENLIPDLNVVKYLDELIREKQQIPEAEGQYRFDYKTHEANITIIQKEKRISTGDFVFIGNKAAPDGKYWFNWLGYIVVKNGRVVLNQSSL